MTKEEIFKAMNELALQHASSGDELEDLKDSDWFESQAFYLIVDYCKSMNYQVGRFPDSIANDDSTEISEKHLMLYADKLTLTNSDVAELHWHWVSSFWPDQFKDKEEFLDSTATRISGGFYDI